MNAIITAKPDLCKRCYGCIRECPAKAILVVNGQASIIQERCIACGHCVKVCTQGAKQIFSAVSPLLSKALTEQKAIAMVAPSFAASWHRNYRKVPAALRKLGFASVIETAFGADLISPQYVKDLETSEIKTIISSSCPAVCNYIEKYRPDLVPNLAKIVSPMAALGRYLRNIYGADYQIVFIGPCTAKKAEIYNPEVSGFVDAAFTFAEIKDMMTAAGIDPDKLEDSPFDPPHAFMGKAYPLAGGLLKRNYCC
jgi:iron only hydrogenase large subunit-like protein